MTRIPAASTMGPFMTLFNGFYVLTDITKNFTISIVVVLDLVPRSGLADFSHKNMYVKLGIG